MTDGTTDAGAPPESAHQPEPSRPPNDHPIEHLVLRLAAGFKHDLSAYLVPLPFIAAALFAIKCALLARFSATVTADLLALSDPVAVLRQIALQLTLLTAWVMYFLALALLGECIRYRFDRVRVWLPTVCVCGLLAGFLALDTWPDSGPFALAFVILPPFGAVKLGQEGDDFGWLKLQEPRTRRGRVGRVLAYLIAGILATILVLSLLSPLTMWLPAERIQTKGAPARTLYVLSDDGSTLVVYSQQRADIERIDGKLVTARQFCSKDLRSHHHMPICP